MSAMAVDGSSDDGQVVFCSECRHSERCATCSCEMLLQATLRIEKSLVSLRELTEKNLMGSDYAVSEAEFRAETSRKFFKWNVDEDDPDCPTFGVFLVKRVVRFLAAHERSGKAYSHKLLYAMLSRLRHDVQVDVKDHLDSVCLYDFQKRDEIQETFEQKIITIRQWFESQQGAFLIEGFVRPYERAKAFKIQHDAMLYLTYRVIGFSAMSTQDFPLSVCQKLCIVLKGYFGYL